MQQKPYKTIDELIELLKFNNLSVTSDGKIERLLLETIGYYNLINGYKAPFLKDGSREIFNDQTTIDEIYALYIFDKSLRRTFLSYLLTVETHIKNLVADTIGLNYGNDLYLTYDKFDTNIHDSYKKITKLISGIQHRISERAADPNIHHYLSKYGSIPPWVLMTVLTFGDISKYYSLLKQTHRHSIAQKFNINEDLLINFLLYLSKIRNFCAHGNRLYCYKARQPLKNTILHNNFKFENKGKNDLFAALIALKFLISQDDFNNLCNEVNEEMNNLASKLTSIDIKDILDKMGFPENWYDLK